MIGRHATNQRVSKPREVKLGVPRQRRARIRFGHGGRRRQSGVSGTGTASMRLAFALSLHAEVKCVQKV